MKKESNPEAITSENEEPLIPSEYTQSNSENHAIPANDALVPTFEQLYGTDDLQSIQEAPYSNASLRTK